jgi:hypothetical protein
MGFEPKDRTTKKQRNEVEELFSQGNEPFCFAGLCCFVPLLLINP